MAQKPFVDYYELFQASPNAQLDTIERLFRYLAQLSHPDVSKTGDIHQFSLLAEGFEILRDSEKRAEYDREYHRQKSETAQLVRDTGCVDSDCDQRHQMLSLLYAKRRQNLTNPGMGDTTLEQLVECPREVLHFHLWYFKEKGWVQREESGMLSITAEGVDKIEKTIQEKAAANSLRLIAMSPDLVTKVPATMV